METTETTETVVAPKEAENQFNWPLCYEAENLLLERIDSLSHAEQFRADSRGADAE